MQIDLVWLENLKKVGHPFRTKNGLKLGFLTICSGIINLCIGDLFVQALFLKSRLF